MAQAPRLSIETLSPAQRRNVDALGAAWGVAPLDAFGKVTLTNPKPKDDRITAWLAEHSKSPTDLAHHSLLAECFTRVEHRLPSRQSLEKKEKAKHTIGLYTPLELETALIQFAKQAQMEDLAFQFSPQLQPARFSSRAKMQMVIRLNEVARADPHNLKSLPHIVRWGKKGSTSFPEDLPDITDTLNAWERERVRLLGFGPPSPDVPLHNLSNFESITALREALPEVTYSAHRRQNWEKAAVRAGGAKLLWEDRSGDCLYHVTTKSGAQVLGRGTKWCTRHENEHNYFDNYKDDLLYLRRGEDVYQLNFRAGHLHGRKDEAVPIAQMVEGAPELLAHFKGPLERALLSIHQNTLPVFTRCLNEKNPDLTEIATTVLTQHLPLIVGRFIDKGPVASILELESLCKKSGDPALERRMQELRDAQLPAIMGRAVLDENFNVMKELLEEAGKSGARALALAKLPSIMQRAAQEGRAGTIQQMLKVCESVADEGLTQAARRGVEPHLSTVFEKVGSRSGMGAIIELHSVCEQTGDEALRQNSRSAVLETLPVIFNDRKKNGDFEKLGEMLTACESVNHDDFRTRVRSQYKRHVQNCFAVTWEYTHYDDVAKLITATLATGDEAFKKVICDSVQLGDLPDKNRGSLLCHRLWGDAAQLMETAERAGNAGLKKKTYKAVQKLMSGRMEIPMKGDIEVFEGLDTLVELCMRVEDEKVRKKFSAAFVRSYVPALERAIDCGMLDASLVLYKAGGIMGGAPLQKVARELFQSNLSSMIDGAVDSGRVYYMQNFSDAAPQMLDPPYAKQAQELIAARIPQAQRRHREHLSEMS